MTPERWREIEHIYQTAVDLDVSARQAYLEQACAGDADLRREVESLLAAHRPHDRFFESGAVNVAIRALAADAPQLTAGQRLGPYELIEPIGAGGMGEVWRGVDAALHRPVAIKILPSQYSRDPDRLRRFEQEARAASMLNHPNVLTIHAFGKHDGSPYLVTELLEGMTLRQRLSTGALPEGRAIEYGDQIVQGLAAAHAKGIVHRDLKPENIFITTDNRVKILDFGLAKLVPSGPVHQSETETATGIAVGTPAYMSPEQVRGQRADHRADIFAIGAVLYEMLAGRRAFAGQTSVATMNAILTEEPQSIASVSPQLEQIVRHCLEKEPAARYQSARDLAFQLRLVQHPSSPTPAPLQDNGRRRNILAVAGVLVLAAAAATLTWWLIARDPPPVAPTLTRLTSDSGLTTDPAFSPDGKLVVYASDRGGAGTLDIWRQQLATGEATPLTNDPADESEPAFSPDGSRIAFRSERDGGGIYIVSVFGGEPRLVAKQGRRPRFSPDGTRIAYWVGHFYIGQIFVVPAAGGSPQPVEPGFASASYPLWSSDGSRLIFVGARDPKDIPVGGYDWWVVPSSGGRAVPAGAYEVLRRQNIRMGGGALSLVIPGDWIADEVFFSAESDEGTHLWKLGVSPNTGKAEGLPRKLTSGTSVEAKPSVIEGGRIAFASLTHTVNIWSMPVEANTGRVRGDARQVTNAAVDARNSVSADGKKLVFVSTRSGNSDVWIKDLETGRETALTATPAREESAEITPDGTRVSYIVYGRPLGDLYAIPSAGGLPERICNQCGRPWDWSPDGSKILYLIGEGQRQAGLAIGLLDVTTGRHNDYLDHPAYSLARARFSPDGRWISFVASNASGAHVVVAPYKNGAPPPEREWVAVTEHAAVAQDKPRWSPEGKILYFVSHADGFRCIWARRLHPTTKRPVGEPIPVYHSHSARRSLTNAPIPYLDLSLTSDTLFFNLAETTGNIWMAEWKPQ